MSAIIIVERMKHTLYLEWSNMFLIIYNLLKGADKYIHFVGGTYYISLLLPSLKFARLIARQIIFPRAIKVLVTLLTPPTQY